MTNQERVLKAMQHEPSNFPPSFLDFTAELRTTLANSLSYSSDYKNYHPQICGYNYCGNPTREIRPNIYLDDFGVAWDRGGLDTSIGLVHEPVINNFSFSNYTFPTLNYDELSKHLKIMIDWRCDNFCMAGIGYSLFERAWSLCSLEKLLLGMLVAKDFTLELFSKICDFNLSVLDVVLEYDIDAVYFGDDWGKQTGLIMGKKNWNIFIKPYLTKMYKKVKKKGKLIIQHSCGNIEELFPDLIEMGVDCYHSFSPDVYNIAEIKKKYGSDLCFWGGISLQDLLSNKNPKSVIENIEKNIDIMNKNGGFILSSSNALTQNYPLENVVTLIRYLNNK